MIKRVMLPAVAGIAGLILSVTGCQAALAQVAPSAAAYDNGIRVIQADLGASAFDPATGQQAWVFGDATQISGKSVVSGYGYPHSEFATEVPGSAVFIPQHGPYGYGWQQVPNWPDGTYFWGGGLVADHGSLWLYGQRIRGASPFTVTGDYVARFSARTLAFEGITALPGWRAARPVRFLDHRHARRAEDGRHRLGALGS